MATTNTSHTPAPSLTHHGAGGACPNSATPADAVQRVNAALNIHTLGAESGTYLPDYYGEMAGINAGLGSDRLLADWVLASDRVAARARGDMTLPQDGIALSPALPDDIEALAKTVPAEAADLRAALREKLQDAFAKGQRIIGFDRVSRRYILSRPAGDR